ncbi:diaminobutyrate--2-oxoglutarate transaminase [Paenibacillus turpanensis]|uniref:diaminobutyrate--2-oxoglutarate transaminase n=1 Tax=Paenibacillus turpanensis TaxID=2689078 RepID=UPI00140A4F76|nr:diaminobutyrate--2-oxoglutarate transaminase [Paenibacillus turpanensis]
MPVLEHTTNPLFTFEKLESEVRSYVRSFPTVFTKGKGYKLWDAEGREYIDFFAGAGALNYGHNDPKMKQKLIDYLMADGVAHSLDMATSAKEAFLNRFNDVILKPRGLTYKVMFPGPTGTNSVESALKLARKATGREKIVCFTNGFHGMTLGALAVTGNKAKRDGAGVPLHHSVVMPFDGYLGEDVNTVEVFEKMLEDSGSGIDLPAAVIVETLQGEGGLNASRMEWLKDLSDMCKRKDILMIIDDIQAGCGRTGTFFSFEEAGIQPDIICLSKSIGGFGLPLAITLFKPELDLWNPGEHNGTFRGNNLAFVAAAEALSYWETDGLEKEVKRKSGLIRAFLEKVAAEYPALEAKVKGRGFMQGIATSPEGLSERICAQAFARGLIMETSGPSSEVMKIMPPLTIDDAGLEKGFAIIEQSIKAALEEETGK